ncbi:unnamed protein product [Mytilus edulis]|uniref:Methyltransferase FkbM domain-containing protein n=1 Tax=Mytilus edulis TaxID=6550 RepID=A0A8S3UT08_MYTED|nr:unnamed protein product [Mytilus edulis]
MGTLGIQYCVQIHSSRSFNRRFDIGANIGVIALQLANVGRKVIAIEPTPQNTQHLCASIIENRYSNQVTVVHNTLSNDHKDVPFAFPNKGEYALGFVDQGKDNVVKEMSKMFGKFYRKTTVPLKAAILDDIMTLPEFKAMLKVFIKIDIKVLNISDVLQDVSSNLNSPCEQIDVKSRVHGEQMVYGYIEENR